MSVQPGPYCTPDLREWWVPIEAIPNRMKAAHEVRACMSDDSVVRYMGVTHGAWLDLEHEGDHELDESGAPPECMIVADCWHFRAEER